MDYGLKTIDSARTSNKKYFNTSFKYLLNNLSFAARKKSIFLKIKFDLQILLNYLVLYAKHWKNITDHRSGS